MDSRKIHVNLVYKYMLLQITHLQTYLVRIILYEQADCTNICFISNCRVLSL
jgi:hypothetical protein